jgi:hypothetical protein
MKNIWMMYVVSASTDSRVRVVVRDRIDLITTLSTISERNGITFCNG